MGFDSEVDCCRTINFKGYSSSFHTEDNMEYDSSLYLQLGNSKSITFTVKAKNDPTIGFMCNSCQDFYEILIGGWFNTKSVIRRKPLGSLAGGEIQKESSTLEIVNANEYWPFWAQVLNGLVRFGTGNIIGQNVILKWQDSNPMIPDSIGFMTGWGSTGDWNIQG